MPSIREFPSQVAATAFESCGGNSWMLTDEFIQNGVGASILRYTLDSTTAASAFGDVEEHGACDRCSFLAAMEETDAVYIYAPIVPIRHVYVASGRYVVHFRLCLDCIGHYASLATHAIRRTYVAGHPIDEHVDLTGKDR